MKALHYTIKAVGNQPFFLSALLGGFFILVILSDTVTTDPNVRLQVVTKYLAWGTAFLSAILMAYSFRPEDSAHLEMQASLLTPLYKIVGWRVLVCALLIILPMACASILIAHLTSQISAITYCHGLIMIIANAFFFGGIAILGTSLGRRSNVGALGSLSLLIVFSLLPLPEVVQPFFQNVGSASYRNSIFVLTAYSLAGAFMFAASMVILKDANYILTGEGLPIVLLRKKTKRLENRQGDWTADAWLQRILSISRRAFPGALAYESFQWLISGWLPIMMGTITVLFGTVSSVGMDMPYHLATNFHRGIIMSFLLLLPPIVCDSIPSDKRNYRTSMILSCVSPQTYLSLKVIGVWITALGTVIISAMPFSVLLGMYVVLSGFPQYLMANIAAFLLAVTPFVVYISSLSVLLGVFANQRPAFAIGGVISIAAVVAYALTSNTIVGNLFFPSGTMAIETIAAWLGKQVATQASHLDPTNTVAPWYLLFAPIAIAIGQIALVWQFVLRSLKQGDN